MRQKHSLYILLRLFLLLLLLLNLNLISVISFSTTAAAAAIAVPFSDFQYAQHYPSSTEDQTQIWETNLSFFHSGNNDDLLFQQQQQQQQAPSVLKNNGHAILEEVPFEIKNIDIPTLLAGQNGGGGAGGAQGGFDCKGQESLCSFGNNYYPNDQTRPFKGTCADASMYIIYRYVQFGKLSSLLLLTLITDIFNFRADGWITNAGFFPGSGPDGQYCSNLKYYHDCASSLARRSSLSLYLAN